MLVFTINLCVCARAHTWERESELVGSLLYDAFSVTRLYSVIIGCWWIGKDLVGNSHGLLLRYYPSIHLEGLRQTTKNINQDNLTPGPRFETGTFQISSRSVRHLTMTFSSELVYSECVQAIKNTVYAESSMDINNLMAKIWHHVINWTVPHQLRRCGGTLIP
jgi:hypothetical protein